MSLSLRSTAFEEEAMIPEEYTCEGDDTSPELAWESAPAGVSSFALIVEDPDAPGGVFTHWIVYNLPSDCQSMEPVIPREKNLENGGIQGQNDFGTRGYAGPCPPESETHRYYFKLFALDQELEQESANTRDDFYQAIEGKIIEEASYMGKFKR